MPPEIQLPQTDGALKPYRLSTFTTFQPPAGPVQCRVAFPAAHMVADPLADINPTLDTCLDWEATPAYRSYLWSLLNVGGVG